MVDSKLLVNQDEILEETKQRMTEAGITEKAEKQLWLYGTIYALAILLGIQIVGHLIVIVLSLGYSLFWTTLGCIVIFLFLCAIYAIWVFFIGGRFDVKTNNIVFIKVFQQYYKPVGPGRHHIIPLLQNLAPLTVGLKPTKVVGTTSIDLKGTKVEGNLPGNPRNKVTANYTLIYRVIKPYIVIMEMPGNTSSDKEELLKSQLQDNLQSYINNEGMNEDQVISLAGQDLGPNILEFKDMFDKWGIEFIGIVIGETEIDKDSQESRKKAYQAQQERENRTRILDGIAHDLFDKSLSDLSIPERSKVNDQWNTMEGYKQWGQPGTRISTGGPGALARDIATRAATSHKENEEE